MPTVRDVDTCIYCEVESGYNTIKQIPKPVMVVSALDGTVGNSLRFIPDSQKVFFN